MGYLKKAATGFGWLGFLKGLTKFFSLLKNIVLARLLFPQDFGLFGITAAVLAIMERFTETGVNTFLVQTRENYRSFINAAWFIAIIRGFCIFLLIYASAFFLPNFYNEPLLQNMLFVASVIPFIKGFINPAIIKFWKEMQFEKEVIFRGILTFIEALGSVLFVVWTHNVIGLIYAFILSAILEVCISNLFITPKPQFKFEREKVIRILKSSSWLNLSAVLAFLTLNIDDLIIGKILGTQSLGYYQYAYKVSQTAVGEIGELGAQTVFPVYSAIQDEKKRMRSAFLKAFVPLSLALIVPVAMLWFYAKPLVSLILGTNWLPLIPVLPYLLIAAYLQALNALIYPVYLAVNKPQYNAVVLFVQVVVTVVLLFVLAPKYGLVGAGIAVLFARIIIQPLFALYFVKSLRKDT